MLDKWCLIYFQKHYDSYDGFVVLHGTDTMSYTASALSFICENLGKPIILTGSQVGIRKIMIVYSECMKMFYLLLPELPALPGILQSHNTGKHPDHPNVMYLMFVAYYDSMISSEICVAAQGNHGFVGIFQKWVSYCLLN